MTSTSLTYKNKKFKNSNSSFDLKNDEEERSESKNSTKILVKNDKNKLGLTPTVISEKTVLSKFKKNSSKIIKELNEDSDSISISESSDSENINNENEIMSEPKKNEKSFTNKKEKMEKMENSSSISEDNPEILKEVEKIMNNNNLIQNDAEKNHEKTNSSFKDDKSTKMEIDRITNMQSYSET